MNGHLNESQLQDYLDGLMAPDEWESTDAHLAGCESCRADLAEFSGLLEDLAGLPPHRLINGSLVKHGKGFRDKIGFVGRRGQSEVHLPCSFSKEFHHFQVVSLDQLLEDGRHGGRVGIKDGKDRGKRLGWITKLPDA